MIAGVVALVIVLLILLYLFLIMPNVGNPADMDALMENYAHRGLWDDRIPENSLPAFARAVQAGCGIELDIQLSKDKQIMVFHDADLKRMCGVSGRICDMTYAELQTLRLKESNEKIPTLLEVLTLVKGRVPLMIEIKGERSDPALCVRASRMLDLYTGAFCIISFSPLILSWFKSYRPCYARGQLVTKITKHERKGSRIVNFLLFHMLLNFISRPDFISVNGLYRNRPIFLICTRIFRVCGFAWTVRTPAAWKECRRAGWFVVFEKLHPQELRSKQKPQ